MLVEPLLLGGQRLGQPRELLVGREVPVADDRRRRHLEVDGPEQRGVQLGLLGRQLVGRRRGEPDDVDAGRRAPPAPRGRRSPTARRGGGTRRARPCATPAARSASTRSRAPGASRSPRCRSPCAPRAISRLRPATMRAISWPRRLAAAPVHAAASRGDGRDGLPRRLRPLLRPARRGRGPQRVAGIVEPRERLVGEARHRRPGPVGHEPGARPERGAGRRPLLLDRRVRREHERGPAKPPQDLEPEQRLAGAGRRDQVGRAVPARPVALERLERERLVPAPGAAELELVHPRIIAGGASRGRPLGPPPLLARVRARRCPRSPPAPGSGSCRAPACPARR